MAVLAEAISVIIKIERLLECVPGGWEAFSSAVPNATLCRDGHLARVGFMSPKDVMVYVSELEKWGLCYLKDNEATDLVVVDQQSGPTMRCTWVQFAYVTLDCGTERRVSACRLTGDCSEQIFTPDDWQYEGSLSEHFLFVPNEAEHTLEKIGESDGMDVMRSPLTESLQYIARTYRPPESGK